MLTVPNLSTDNPETVPNLSTVRPQFVPFHYIYQKRNLKYLISSKLLIASRLTGEKMPEKM